MYVKLAIRNAKRSICNYLLYMITMTILIAIMIVSNHIAIVGKIQAGFQTASLPILITCILVILVAYVNKFMLKQRAKEFANYLLLGMERSSLSRMFFIEFLIIGFMCFIMGALIGSGIYGLFYSIMFQLFQNSQMQFSYFIQSLMQSFLYFFIVEILTLFYVKQNIDKLQIGRLMIEERRNQKVGDKQQIYVWAVLFIISLLCFIVLLIGISFFPNSIITQIMISIIMIPLLILIFSFYKCFFTYFVQKRQKQSKFLYQYNYLYIIAEITSEIKTNVIMNSIFCICLILSTMSFLFGIIMIQPDSVMFDRENQQWMGFLQISLSIIFIVIYFSILSLLQIINFQKQIKDIQILNYIGKSKDELKALIKKQTLIKLSIPAIMYIFLFIISVPIVNNKINIVLPTTMKHTLIKSSGWFLICFLVLYFSYFAIVCVTSRRYIRNFMNKQC